MVLFVLQKVNEYFALKSNRHLLFSAISICCENNNIMEFLVEGSRSILMEKLLREREIAFEIIGFENTPGRSSSPRARSGFTSTIKSTWRKGEQNYTKLLT